MIHHIVQFLLIIGAGSLACTVVLSALAIRSYYSDAKERSEAERRYFRSMGD